MHKIRLTVGGLPRDCRPSVKKKRGIPNFYPVFWLLQLVYFYIPGHGIFFMEVVGHYYITQNFGKGGESIFLGEFSNTYYCIFIIYQILSENLGWEYVILGVDFQKGRGVRPSNRGCPPSTPPHPRVCTFRNRVFQLM